MAACLVDEGGTWYDAFETVRNGARVDAVSLPTVTAVHVNCVIDATLTGNITQLQDATPAPITGVYCFDMDLSSLNDGDHVSVCIEADINGKTVQIVKEARVRSKGMDTCFIRS